MKRKQKKRIALKKKTTITTNIITITRYKSRCYF